MANITSIAQMVRDEATKASLDPNTILGIIKVESNFNPNAVRYERNFLNYFKTKDYAKIQGITEDSENCLQKFSWGLMQVMGGTARWLGYGGFLPDLSNPVVGIQWGVEYFKRIANRYIYLTDQLAVYNRGSVQKDVTGRYTNQNYVDHVLSAIESVQGDLLKSSVLQ